LLAQQPRQSSLVPTRCVGLLPLDPPHPPTHPPTHLPTHPPTPAHPPTTTAGCEGVAAINTIQSVMGINLDTLKPEPAVEGYTTPGGYSYKAVKPIALAKVGVCVGWGCGGVREQSGLTAAAAAAAAAVQSPVSFQSPHSILHPQPHSTTLITPTHQPPTPPTHQVMSISRMMEAGGYRGAGASLSGIGGIDSGADAAEFILLGSDTVQVCTGVMIHGYPVVKNYCGGLQVSAWGA